MTLSIWRYAHLLLAIVASAFILITSITGAILALEPALHQAKGYDVENLKEISVSQSLEALSKNYDEVFSIEIEPSGFVKASVLNFDFETKDIYINPKTGETLGPVLKQAPIFGFATNIHRSLFLKTTGRGIVGATSFLLLIITLTGMMLIVKRQGGIKRFFSKVHKDNPEKRYHVIFGKWVFIPVIVISFTGAFLSAERFNLLPDTKPPFAERLNESHPKSVSNTLEIPFFVNTNLSEIRKIEFPFSPNEDDYFYIQLKEYEVVINQHTGELMSKSVYPLLKIASHYSLILHTGNGNTIWSVALFITAVIILFFIYSGFAMAIKRKKHSQNNSISKIMSAREESEYILLVGSENGTTLNYANQFAKALIQNGKKVFVDQLNHYQNFKSAKHLIIFTATYGDGEAPTNARKFETIIKNTHQENQLTYSVVGFGSKDYRYFCAFADKVDKLLNDSTNLMRILTTYKINNSNPDEFLKWVKQWQWVMNISLDLKPLRISKKNIKKLRFRVIERSPLNQDQTFLLKLKPFKAHKFSSGDLFAIIPPGCKRARQYSIAKLGDEIVLSIKRHRYGKCSNFLLKLKPGDEVKGYLESNPNFHFPKNPKSAVLIANGTGIGPFLGMTKENNTVPIHLLWGGRTVHSGNMYNDLLLKTNHNSQDGKLQNLNVYRCFSRENYCRRYVQDLVKEQAELIVENFKNEGVCMICGSIAMQNEVLHEIDRILKEKSDISLDTIQEKGLLKMDCY